ncbi:LPXTG cell wall anchor domain-containing protein [Lactococcus lactis]|nr:LPXTG cell wall anchor domain-containing protein [Lactococcus lactis]
MKPTAYNKSESLPKTGEEDSLSGVGGLFAGLGLLAAMLTKNRKKEKLT